MRESRESLGVDHYFSDEYQPHLEEDGPTRYVREDVSKFELKKLKRGSYPPEICTDLHGMNQQQAKQELAALLTLCRRENIHVASVMHGIGKHILKQRIPSWLAQHPNVQAFHQAPASGAVTAPSRYCWISRSNAFAPPAGNASGMSPTIRAQ